MGNGLGVSARATVCVNTVIHTLSLIARKTNDSDDNCCRDSKAIREIVKTSKFIIKTVLYGALKFIKHFPVVLHIDHLGRYYYYYPYFTSKESKT